MKTHYDRERHTRKNSEVVPDDRSSCPTFMHTAFIRMWKVLQYPVALVAAALTSIFSAILLVGLPVSLMHFLVGFLGVFIGSLVFLPGSRRSGAVFLAIVGVSFVYARVVWFDTGPASVPDGPSRLTFVALGALFAVTAHVAWWRLIQRRNAAE